ncbi:MAG: hypothetical protein H6734_17110 [Alphaproteobacteria bacterium]|nr:hypothetical protein [Alphaproteobacteria bacterium]
MNFKTAALVGLTLSLFGCPGGDTEEPTATEPTDDTAPTGDTEPPPPPTPDPTFDVNLVDGPGPDDGSLEADQMIVTVTNPPAGTWYFGYGQTATEAANGQGWFGEDCLTGDTCHEIPAATDVGGTPTSTLTLDRVATIPEVTGGVNKMLLQVDNPPSATPDLTFYIGAQTDPDTCYVFGHDPSYYATLGCMDPGTAATHNDI